MDVEDKGAGWMLMGTHDMQLLVPVADEFSAPAPLSFAPPPPSAPAMQQTVYAPPAPQPLAFAPPALPMQPQLLPQQQQQQLPVTYAG